MLQWNKLKTILVLLILFLTLFTPLTPIVDTTQLKTHGSSQETPLAYTVEAPYIVPLAMGSTNIPVGFVKVWNDNEYLYVLFEIDLDSYPTYKMYQTHLYLSKTQPVWSAPGLWPYSNTYPYPNMVTSDLYKIPLADIDGGVGVNETIYIMAHATIYQDNIQMGSAYGGYFKGYFTYTIQEQPPPTPTISLLKTGPIEAYPGGVYNYLIVVSNTGSVVVDNVVVEDTLPWGVEYISADPAPSEIVGNTVKWNIGTISINGYVLITLTVRFSPELTPGTPVVNNAIAWGENSNTATANFTTMIVAGPSLVIEKTGTSISYPGSLITYILKITNDGNETAYDVTVYDYIQLDRVDVVSTTPASVITNNTVKWSIGTLSPGSTIYLYLVVRVRESVSNGTLILNRAEVTWRDNTGQLYGPRSDEFTTLILSNPQLTIVKSGPLTTLPNQLVTYTITVYNAGGSPAYNVTVVDQLPPEVTFVTSTPTPFSISGSTVTFKLSRLNPGEYYVILITVNMSVVVEGDYEDYVNNASVTWSDIDSRSYGPVRDAIVTRVYSRPQIILGKIGSISGYINETISFTITVVNTGGSTAYNVTVWDYLPYGIKLVSSNYTYQYDNETRRITWLIEELGPGETIIITIQARVCEIEYDGVIVINNVYANWSDVNGEPYGPVTDFHPVRLFVNPYVEVYKSAPTLSQPGVRLTYTIRLVNPTLTVITGVELVDYLPSRVTYLSSTPLGVYNASTHTIKWSNLTIPPGGELVFSVEVLIHTGLINGSLIINEAVATWPTGSSTGLSTTMITTPPPPPTPTPPRAVGGEVVYDYSAIIIVVVGIAIVLLTSLVFIEKKT